MSERPNRPNTATTSSSSPDRMTKELRELVAWIDRNANDSEPAMYIADQLERILKAGASPRRAEQRTGDEVI